MIEVLATMRPDCYIFEKGFVPALIDREMPKDVMKAVDNADGFWSGQPMLGTIGKSSKSAYSVLNRMLGNGIDSKLARAKERMAAQAARIDALEQKKGEKIAKKNAQQELAQREHELQLREQRVGRQEASQMRGQN